MGTMIEPLSSYLNALRQRAGMSLEQIAKEAGYAGRSSIQRYFGPDETLEEVRKDVAQRLARVFLGRGSPPIEISDLARLAGITTSPGDQGEIRIIASALNLRIESVSNVSSYDSPQPTKGIRVVGASHASFWMPSAPSLDVAHGWLEVPFADRDVPERYALLIRGTSINKEAEEGHYAICHRFDNGTIKAPEGRFVHVERHRKGEVEWTIKKARWTADGFTLWPSSTDPLFQEPLMLGDADDQVIIRGIVVGWYKPA